MVLVGYSDSEGSDTDGIPVPPSKPAQKPSAQTNFAIDKANPKKIRVNLNETLPPPADREDGEPAAKRPRIRAGAFSGFNAMLPAPKRDNVPAQQANSAKGSTRKVFSLKTGAEPAFSRASNAEMRNYFAEQDGGEQKEEDTASTIPSSIPKPTLPSESAQTTQVAGKSFMFKPLSVARNSKKNKSAASVMKASEAQPTSTPSINNVPLINGDSAAQTVLPVLADPPKKISLFSSGMTEPMPEVEQDDGLTAEDDEDEIVEVLDDDQPQHDYPLQVSKNEPEDLTSIASELNLSAAERRQLLGRHPNKSFFAQASKVINFNTDDEYAANQQRIAAGEQVQHNPVRAIAPGKHSLKQMISSAQGQKDALEESFARGKTNKREAGSKYGW